MLRTSQLAYGGLQSLFRLTASLLTAYCFSLGGGSHVDARAKPDSGKALRSRGVCRRAVWRSFMGSAMRRG